MVNWKPSTLKIVVSFLVGLIGGSFGLFRAWGKYSDYQEIQGFGNYFTLWETVVRNGYLVVIVIGFFVGIVAAYLAYSLLSKKSEIIEG